MTSTNSSGFAFPEVLIASAIFSAGILALAKLEVTTAANVAALEASQTHLQYVESLTISMSHTPHSPTFLTTQFATPPAVTVALDAAQQGPLPAPLFSAQLRVQGSQGRPLTRVVLVADQDSGQWQDVVALYQRKQEQ